MADQLIAGIAPVFDSGGNIVAGGSVTFYETGTTTLVTIYSDQAASIPMTNPVTLDSAGRAPQIFYTGAVAVKEVVKSAAGVEIDTIDPSPRFSTTSSAADGVSFSPIGSNPNTNVQDAIAAVSESLASFSDSPVAAVAGTANALALTSGKSFTSIPTGQRLSFIGALTNTGAMTVAVDGLPAKAIKTIIGSVTPAGYVRASVLTTMYYDGAQWIADRLPECGSVANGEFFRYADGSVRCSRTDISGSATLAADETLSGTWTYPTGFVAGGPTHAFATARSTGTDANTRAAAERLRTATGTGTTTAAWAVHAQTTGIGSVRVDLTATGRWYPV